MLPHISNATSIPRCAKHGTHYTTYCPGCDACREVHLLRQEVARYETDLRQMAKDGD